MGFDCAKEEKAWDPCAVVLPSQNVNGSGIFQRLLRYSDVDEFELKSWELRVALCLQTVSDIDQRSFVECYFSAAGWPVEAAAPAECAET